jgi:propanediol utilization protein
LGRKAPIRETGEIAGFEGFRKILPVGTSVRGDFRRTLFR